jgi:hypothetical protein
MAIGLRHFYSPILILVLGCILSCAKPKTLTAPAAPGNNTPEGEQFAVTASELKNCRFTSAEVTYSRNQPIPPNPVTCDSGVASSSEVVSAKPLPPGLRFNSGSLRLEGTPVETSSSQLYQIYLENSSGYLIIPLRIQVQ